jgi:hypothetical protein
MSSVDPLDEAGQFRATLQAQTSSLRDTAKWLASGVFVAAAGMVAGGALASFGSLETALRIGIAICGGAGAMLALGVILHRALDVLTPRLLPLYSFADPKIVPPRERTYLETTLAELFPLNSAMTTTRITHFKDLNERMAAVRHDINSQDTAIQQQAALDAVQINTDLAIFVPAATFEELRYRFIGLRRRVMVAGSVVIFGLALFVWAVNPPKTGELLSRPTLEKMAINALDRGSIDKMWQGSGCGQQSSLTALVIRRRDSGVEDIVTMPSGNCQESIRLQRRRDRLLPPDDSK